MFESDVVSCPNVLKQDVYEPDFREEMSHRLSSRWGDVNEEACDPLRRQGADQSAVGSPGASLQAYHMG